MGLLFSACWQRKRPNTITIIHDYRHSYPTSDFDAFSTQNTQNQLNLDRHPRPPINSFQGLSESNRFPDSSVEATSDHIYPTYSTTPIPIDAFLIDISNEQVRLGEPVSLNIRHLLLNLSEEKKLGSASLLQDQPVSKTIVNINEDFLSAMSTVCEVYPNTTVDADQATHNTLHAHLPLHCFSLST